MKGWLDKYQDGGKRSVDLRLPNYEKSKPSLNPYAFYVKPTQDVHVLGLGAHAQGDINDRLNLSGGLHSASVKYPGGSHMFMKPEYHVGVKYNFEDGGTMQEHQENYNDSAASYPPGFVGMGNNTKGRNYSPAWGGQFEDGGELSQAQNGKTKRKVTLEDNLNNWLGHPMDRAERKAEQVGEKWYNSKTKKWEEDDAVDNLRHPLAGRYSAESIANKFPSWMQYTSSIPKLAGFIGANALGIGHELKEPNYNSDYSLWDTIREGGEDIFNNMVGAGVGSLPFLSSDKKTEILKYLSDNNWLPDGMGKIDPKLNNGKADVYVNKKAMGGSIPGSVGFTYARTKGIPSEGPYAKKTLPSAQDGTKKQKDWLQSYVQSPKYKERLGKEFAGKDDKFINNEVNARLNNLLNEKVDYVRSIGSDPGFISGMTIPKQYDGEWYDYKQDKFLPGKWGPDPLGRGYDKKGHVYLENEYRPNAWDPTQGYETIPLHEFGHAADDGGVRIPTSTKKKIFNYTKSDASAPNYRSQGMTFDYYNTPTEFINRIQPVRYLLNNEGLYDARTKDFTEKDYNNMIKNKNINKNVHYQDVMKSLKGTPEQKKKAFVDLMNSIAMQDDNANVDVAENGKEMSYYQNGLDWKPKSISKNGSVIEDDMGQWAHPGKITKINSNQITMKGVPYPVLGISDAGDQQMMYPEQEYTFKGKTVTEYPQKKKNGGWLNKYN